MSDYLSDTQPACVLCGQPMQEVPAADGDRPGVKRWRCEPCTQRRLEYAAARGDGPTGDPAA